MLPFSPDSEAIKFLVQVIIGERGGAAAVLPDTVGVNMIGRVPLLWRVPLLLLDRCQHDWVGAHVFLILCFLTTATNNAFGALISAKSGPELRVGSALL